MAPAIICPGARCRRSRCPRPPAGRSISRPSPAASCSTASRAPAARTWRPSPAGWDQIPGARGCTPQSLAFRAHQQEISALGAALFGLSTQPPAVQAEIATRLKLPFLLLSDARLAFARALKLPTFEVEGTVLIRRLTLIATQGTIEHVFYPVFPPDQNAALVVAWLQTHRR